MRRDVAHRQASWKVGRQRTGSEGGYKRQERVTEQSGGRKVPAASEQPHRDPDTLLRTKPRGFYPRRQKEPSRSGDRCQPCPGELGTVGVKDDAQPASCLPPPPPPAGKMLSSLFSPRRALLPSSPSALRTLHRSLSLQ